MKIILLVILSFYASSWAMTPNSHRKTLYYRAVYDPRQEVIKVAAAGGLDKRVLLAIWWVESKQATWSKRGKDGEYGPFQILPSTGHQFCKGLRWKGTFRHNAKCAVNWLNYGKRRCKIGLPWQLGDWYNQGRCKWRSPSAYAVKLVRAL